MTSNKSQQPPSRLTLRYLPQKDAQLGLDSSKKHILDEIVRSQVERASRLERRLRDPNLATLFEGERYYSERQISRILCPISSIPSELLLRIFREYVHSTYLPTPDDCFSAVEFRPWIPSQVCRGWRAIVFSSSSLWNKVTFESISIYGHDPTHKLRAVPYLLSRQMILSSNQPLDVTVVASSPVAAHHSDILDILSSHKHRWQTFEVTSYDTAESAERNLKLFSGASPEFSILEVMVINIADPAFSLPDNMHLPRLRSLTLELSPENLAPLPSIPWQNLTTLKIANTSITHVFSILPSLSSLIRLHLDDIRDHLVNPTPVVLPLLDSLSLSYADSAFVVDILTMPSLRYLSMNGLEEHVVNSMLPMIRRSGCSVSTLNISLSTPQQILRNYLSTFPKLTMMEVALPHRFEEYGVTLYFFEFMGLLSAKDTDGNFSTCPLLEHLHLSNMEGNGHFEEEHRSAFLEMLETRTGVQATASCCLKSLVLEELYTVHEEFGRKLDALKARGLQTTVVSGS